MKVVLAGGLVLSAAFAHGHGGHAGVHADGTSRDQTGTVFGRPGDFAKIAHTITVEIGDAYCRLAPEVRLRQGETASFVARNTGTRTHELVLGTSHELKQHAAQSANDPDLDHDEPAILHVEPGSTGAIVWRFTRVGLFRYGCLIHGTQGSEMAGRIYVFR